LEHLIEKLLSGLGIASRKDLLRSCMFDEALRQMGEVGGDVATLVALSEVHGYRLPVDGPRFEVREKTASAPR
jgi:hypothetical protein